MSLEGHENMEQIHSCCSYLLLFNVKKHNRHDLELSVLWLNKRALKYDLSAVWCLLKKTPTHISAEDTEIVERYTSKCSNKMQRKSPGIR